METSLQIAGGLQNQASTDDQLIRLWLYGRTKNTQDAYSRDIQRFRDFTEKSLQDVTLADVQCFDESLSAVSTSTRKRVMSAIKSLLSFGHRIGYLQFNVGAAFRLPRSKDTLAQRILSEAVVQEMIATEPNSRNKALLRLLYASGGRVSEICDLTWKDCVERGSAGQITLFGKGDKTRTVLLSEHTWKALMAMEDNRDGYVFMSRKGGRLDRSQVFRIVQAAARRVGINGTVSPHWMRHAHATHSLERGCPIHVVQATLGHASVATTGRYLHVRPTESSARYLAI